MAAKVLQQWPRDIKQLNLVKLYLLSHSGLSRSHRSFSNVFTSSDSYPKRKVMSNTTVSQISHVLLRASSLDEH